MQVWDELPGLHRLMWKGQGNNNAPHWIKFHSCSKSGEIRPITMVSYSGPAPLPHVLLPRVAFDATLLL
jgi:hypothetical protein